MSIILTHLNNYGIIHASDSNLTGPGSTSDEGKKTFEVPALGAGLTVAGVFTVAGLRMDSWMSEFILTHSGTETTVLSEFVHRLADELQSEMLPEEKDKGSMVHIAGYVKGDNDLYHPEFWFVRNVNYVDPATGDYGDIRPEFGVDEQFWARDCPKANLMESF